MYSRGTSLSAVAASATAMTIPFFQMATKSDERGEAILAFFPHDLDSMKSIDKTNDKECHRVTWITTALCWSRTIFRSTSGAAPAPHPQPHLEGTPP